jgi:molybdopterin molybdotransferase
MVSVDEARDEIMARCGVLGVETVDALTSNGRVLARGVVSGEAVPPRPKSAVDGYAIRTTDSGPRRLRMAEIAAAPGDEVHIEPGEAIRIMTGGDVPTGADAVVMVEDSCETAASVEFTRDVQAGANILPTGHDITVGQVVASVGDVIGPAEIGLMATIGVTRIEVYRRPRVAVMATGDELVEPWETPPRGAIRESNRWTLMAALADAGCDVTWHGVARDNEESLHAAYDAALAVADVVITSGGVSMGTRDLIKPLLESRGTVHFGRVNFKPGKPLTFASIRDKGGDKRWFGLPGYPVSSLVTLEVFVRPALLAMQGRRDHFRPTVDVTLDHDVRPDRGRPEYQRASVRWGDGRLRARSTGGQSSSRLLSMRGANALLVIPTSDQVIRAESVVQALLTGPIAQ